MKILYNQNDIIAVNKPSGMLVHEDGSGDIHTVCKWLENEFPEAIGVGEPMHLQNGEVTARTGIVHRLDRDTSGVLLLAKTQAAHAFLKHAFQNREIKKIYKAFVYGKVRSDSGIIDESIGRSIRDFRLRAVGRSAKGFMRKAVSEYVVDARSETASMVTLHPITGRTHQLRVHMKSVHHPIVCDPLYAPKKECLLGFERLALHAHKIRFLINGKEQTIVAPLPDDFERAKELTGKGNDIAQ
jgi:23S rRNA pseudouridine1911/1915/1917 synthase